MFREIDKSTYRRGHIVISSLLASILIVTFIQRFSLMMENRRREYLSQDEYERRAAIKEACDWVGVENIIVQRIFDHFYHHFSIRMSYMCYEEVERRPKRPA